MFYGAIGVGTRLSPRIPNAKITLLASADNVHWGNAWVTKTNAAGNYGFYITLKPAHTYYFRTYYAGSTTYREAFSPIVKVTVPTKISTTVSFLAIPLESVKGKPMGATFGLTAKGKGISGEPVSFFIDGKYAGQATTSTGGSGEFYFSTNGLTLGRHEFTASFAGSAQYAPSTGNAYVNIVTSLT